MRQRWELTPAQSRLLVSTSRFILPAGDRGAGKTSSVLWKIYFHMMKYPNARVLIGRRTIPSLMRTVIKDWYADIIPSRLVVKRRDSNPMGCTLKNGAELFFVPLDDEKLVGDLMSGSFSIIFIDQAKDDFLTRKEFDDLDGCLRTPDTLHHFVMACNPHGHSWIHNDFVDPRTRKEDHEYIYFPYEQNKMNLPAQTRQAWEKKSATWKKFNLQGSWDEYAGLVWPQFDPNINVIPRGPLPPHMRKYRAIDHGYSGYTCCLWGALMPNGVLIVYKEMYDLGLMVTQIADRILEMSGDEKYVMTVIDPSTRARTRERYHQRYSIAQEYAEYGVPVIPANSDKNVGINRVAEMLTPVKGLENIWTGENTSPRLMFMDNCKKTIEDIQTYQHVAAFMDARGELHMREDTRRGRDHGCDATRYLTMALPRSVVRVEEEEEDTNVYRYPRIGRYGTRRKAFTWQAV